MSSPFIQHLKEYLESIDNQLSMLDAAERFADEHLHAFDIESETHKLEYTEIHKKYQDLFEQHLDTFLSQRGHTREELEAALPQAVAEDPDMDQLVQWMYSVLEYTFFVQVMVSRKKEVIKRQEQAQVQQAS